MKSTAHFECHSKSGIPGKSMSQNKKFKFASANALRSCDRSMTIYNTHTQIHINAKIALPDQMINYKQALTMYKGGY